MQARSALSTRLEVRKLSARYPLEHDILGRIRKWNHVLKNVSLQVGSGETLGVIGESGCGKTTLLKAILGLIPIHSGKFLLHDRDITQSKRSETREIQPVFQDPQSSLNPRMRVWKIITEGMLIEGNTSKKQRMERASELVDMVGLPRNCLNRFPHAFSGGQRQRIAIARALATNPQLIILDEPTSALDVSVQAQVINLLLDLQHDFGLSYILISHDMSVIGHFCHRVAVIYAGEIVEQGLAQDVLNHAVHPYTQTLLKSIPKISSRNLDNYDVSANVQRQKPVADACLYYSRCDYGEKLCEQAQATQVVSMKNNHIARCHRVNGGQQF